MTNQTTPFQEAETEYIKALLQLNENSTPKQLQHTNDLYNICMLVKATGYTVAEAKQAYRYGFRLEGMLK